MLFSQHQAAPLTGELRYIKSDHSFLYKPEFSELNRRTGGGSRTSLVADTLQLEVSVDTGELLFVWGYWPLESCKETSIKFPKYRSGRVFVEDDEGLEDSVSVPLPSDEWKTNFDPQSGVVRIFSPYLPSSTFTKIAHDVVIGLSTIGPGEFFLTPKFDE